MHFDRRLGMRMMVAVAMVLGSVPIATAADLATGLQQGRSASESSTVIAAQGWWYLAAEVAAYRDPAPADRADGPLAGIRYYHDLLAAHDIELVVMPVPGKIASHPQALLGAGAWRSVAVDEIYAALAEAGVTVLDLRPAFAELSDQGGVSHCRQDSHWHPTAIERSAVALSDHISAADWSAGLEAGAELTLASETIAAVGDLPPLIDASPDPESITLRVVGEAATTADDSPVVVIGDSHCLVFHQPIAGGIEASGGGLVDHLCARTGLTVDLVANQGSGINAPWARLARRRGDQANLAGKRVVIWCFAARDLLDPAVEWKRIPVIR